MKECRKPESENRNMSDSRNIVTGVFVAAAVVLSVMAYAFYPKAASSGMEEQVNKPLFKFDPEKVRSLAIVKFDSERNSFDELVMDNHVVNGWSIPSKFGYPVDSAEKLVLTASSLAGLVVLGIASEDPTDEETYGVVEPKPGLKAGQKGVGTRVTLKNREKQDIASIIIGKEVKDRPGQRFVRVPEQRFIYVCEYDPSVLTTDFFEWINPRILDFGTQWSVRNLSLDKYGATKTALLEVNPSYRADLLLDQSKWTTLAYVDSADAKASPSLDVAELERVRLAIENFEIQDVARKSRAMALSLQQRNGIPNTFQVLGDLQRIGFFLDEMVSPAREMGAGGELAFTSTVGIRYRMLFGNLLASEATGRANDQRYVMVSADVDPDFFPMPAKPQSGGGTPEKKNDAPVPPGGGNCGEATNQDDDREARRQYQIKLEERKNRIELTRNAADQINKRFSDWFYVIDNELYRRLMPDKGAIVSKNQ